MMRNPFQLIGRLFDDINKIANCIAANRMQDVLITLSPQDRDLLANYRRRQAKKEKA